MTTNRDLPKDSPARSLGTKVLTDQEFEQAVEDVLSLGESYAYEFSVRLVAALIQDKAREREQVLELI